MKFSAFNTDFSSPSANRLSSRTSGRWASKRGTPLESGYFTGIGSFSMKTDEDRHRHTALQLLPPDAIFKAKTH